MNRPYAHRPCRIDSQRAAQLREEVLAFHAEYCSVLDRGDLEQWPLFFTEDALYRITGLVATRAGMALEATNAERIAALIAAQQLEFP